MQFAPTLVCHHKAYTIKYIITFLQLFQDENPEDFYVKYFDSKWDSWVDVMDDWTVSEKVKLKMGKKMGAY